MDPKQYAGGLYREVVIFKHPYKSGNSITRQVVTADEDHSATFIHLGEQFFFGVLFFSKEVQGQHTVCSTL